MKKDLVNLTECFTQEEARDVLARAIRLQQVSSDGLSIAELKRAALDVGISAEAIDAAIAEHREHPRGTATVVVHLPRLLLQGLGAGSGLALVSQGIARTLSGHGFLDSAPVTLLLWLMVSGALAMLRSAGGSRAGFLEYQARSLGLFLGALGGTLLLSTGPLAAGPDAGLLRWMVAGMALTIWGASSAVGGVIAAWRSRSRSDGARTTPNAPQILKSIKLKVAGILRRASDRLANRSLDAVRP
jgi:hypothetical protein